MVMSVALLSSFQCKRRSSKAMRRRRGRKRPRGDDLVAPEIPLDLQIEILTRLPAKSLMRFKCVSKHWSCLIRSRYFSNLYFTVASPHRGHRLYMSLIDHHVCTGSMEGCHNPGESALLSFSSSSSNSAESFHQDLAMPGMGGRNMIVLRGLLLYFVCRKACIYNPTTRQSLTLPAIKTNVFAQEECTKYALYFLGHDPVLDQYKVVCSVVISSENLERITSEHWVFVLEAGTGSWQRVEFEQPHMPTRAGICINGVIYYLASTCMSRSIVVSFDVRSEEFKMFQVPHEVSALGKVLGFIEYGGRPTILDYTNLLQKGLVHLWVLGHGGNWSTKSLVLQPHQMHLVDNDIPLIVHGTTPNGEVILAPFDLISPLYILYYDLRKNDIRKVTIGGIPDHWSSKLCTDVCLFSKLIDKNESIMYLEI